MQQQHVPSLGSFISPAWAARPPPNGILGLAPLYVSIVTQVNMGSLNIYMDFLVQILLLHLMEYIMLLVQIGTQKQVQLITWQTTMPINNSQPYGGPHNIYMGNGDSMSISHTSNLPFSLGSSTFTLQNVFHIPSICKNLLSVACFTKDNHVFFLFALDFYQIYCLCTGCLLFQGLYKDGLYPLNLSSVSTSPQALASVHSSIWHNRLGHPSSNVFAYLGPTINSKLSFPSFFLSRLCT